MKIACIVDTLGKVQHKRLCILQKYIDDHFEMFSTKTKTKNRRMARCDVVYLSNPSYLVSVPKFSGDIFCSITSHKCLENKKQFLSTLKRFSRISVNNTILFNEFKNNIERLYYTPNGVDRSLFCFSNKSLGSPIKIGWVGNMDRAAKNYENIVLPLTKYKFNNVVFSILATSKYDNPKNMLTSEKMLEYYRSLDFLMITSTTEGTPNPGLEALSCGIPLITTRVGNMIEIIEHDKNGVFCNPIKESFIDAINSISSVSSDKYNSMRIAANDSMMSWDWGVKSKEWIKFFKGI